MKFSSLLCTTASLVTVTSGFLLQTTQEDLKNYGFIRLNYGNDYVDGGFYSSGSYVSIELDDEGTAKSTSDLGTMVMRKVDDAVWLMTFTITGPPKDGDIIGPWKMEDDTRKFMLKDFPDKVWGVCGDPGKYQLYISDKPIELEGCIKDVPLVVAKLE